jgi:hypothetical protein
MMLTPGIKALSDSSARLLSLGTPVSNDSSRKEKVVSGSPHEERQPLKAISKIQMVSIQIHTISRNAIQTISRNIDLLHHNLT